MNPIEDFFSFKIIIRLNINEKESATDECLEEQVC